MRVTYRRLSNEYRTLSDAIELSGRCEVSSYRMVSGYRTIGLSGVVDVKYRAIEWSGSQRARERLTGLNWCYRHAAAQRPENGSRDLQDQLNVRA